MATSLPAFGVRLIFRNKDNLPEDGIACRQPGFVKGPITLPQDRDDNLLLPFAF
jgi:hypothetical protein